MKARELPCLIFDHSTLGSDTLVNDDFIRAGVRLNGPAPHYDRRLIAARSDLADIALADHFLVPHYAIARAWQCLDNHVAIMPSPSEKSVAVSELIFGEYFCVLEVSGGWCWGYSTHDHYCGYIWQDALSSLPSTDAAHIAPTYIVDNRAALVFAEPDIKSRILARRPMGALLTVSTVEDDGKFAQLADGGFVSLRHVRPITDVHHRPWDAVDYARQLLGAPYVWGGRNGDGLDCSGLVQLVMRLTGRNAPRDSDQQRDNFGRHLTENEALQRGDLVYFPGHVGIMADDKEMIHANAYWMQCVQEPLADVIARFDDPSKAVLARKRVDDVHP